VGDRAAVEAAMDEFCRERDIELSSLGLTLMVDFLQERVGHFFYNRGIADASSQTTLTLARLQDELDLLRKL
jgi:uncharacterized protein (DUF2164 family)